MGRRVLTLFVVLALTAIASATRIQISEPSCNVNVTSNTFDISSLLTGTGSSKTYCNDTSNAWTSLLLVINQTNVTSTRLTASDILCNGGNAFDSCSVTQDATNSNLLDVQFWGVTAPPPPPPASSPFASVIPAAFGPPPPTGIPVGAGLTIDTTCTDGCGNTPTTWPTGITGTAYANTAEPASLALLCSGIAAVFFRRKYWK